MNKKYIIKFQNHLVNTMKQELMMENALDAAEKEGIEEDIKQ